MKQIAYLGLGAMGSGMAGCLVNAGYEVAGFDTDPSRMDTVDGLIPCGSLEDAVSGAAFVLLSLPGPDIAEAVFERIISLGAPDTSDPRPLIIDMGTLTPGQGRQWGERFAEAGWDFLEAPVTGGVKGAAEGRLRIFAGGPEQSFARATPVLKAMAQSVYHCGDHGMGSIAKGVNQLAMGLVQGAVLEALFLGVRSGLKPDQLGEWIGSRDPYAGWRHLFAGIADAAAEGNAGKLGVKAGQLAYYLGEAEEQGFVLPMTDGLHQFLKDAEPCIPEANRLSPSFWNELLNRGERS